MSVPDTAGRLLDTVLRAPPTLRDGRVVAVDGSAGAGKTTIAAALAARGGDADLSVEVVHMDDLYDGWRGVLTVGVQVTGLLRSLNETGAASYRRFDWHRGEYAEERHLVVPDLLVLEGVGCCHPAHDDLLTLRVWVGAPRELRLRRGLARDGQHLEDQWREFLDDEEAVHRRDRTRERADVVVDGSTGTVVEVRSRAPGRHGPRSATAAPGPDVAPGDRPSPGSP